MMRKGIKADSRLDFEELFFDGSFDTPLLSAEAGKYRLPLEMVRLAPSAVNRQPWRVVLSGDRAHFYKKQSKSAGGDAWDVQKIDIGIALCHFELGAAECGVRTALAFEEPCIANAEGLAYVASYSLGS